MAARPSDTPAISDVTEAKPPAQLRHESDMTVTEVTVKREFIHEGPLPSPDVLAAYGQIAPDLVDRIVAASEDERAHRHRMDILQSRRASLGLGAGFAIAVLFLAVSAWLIYNGHSVAGVVLGSFDLVALTAVFVLGRHNGLS